MDKVLDAIASLVKLNFIGKCVEKGLFLPSTGRAIESSIHSAEITLLTYLYVSLSTQDWSYWKLAVYTFCTTVATGIISGILMQLRQKEKAKAEVLEVANIQ